ncbi:MAG: hypothetical protein IKQ59_00230 [Prevotella sp.]|nr:hypothetical protein [Prevotella sp.]
MRKVLLSFSLVFSLTCVAQTILDLTTLKAVRGAGKAIPCRDVDITADGVTVTYLFDNIELCEDPMFTGASFVKIDGFYQNHVAGEPALLTRWDTFVVPDGNAVVSIIDSTFVEYPLELSPARPVLSADESISLYRERVIPVSEYEGLMPCSTVPVSRKDKYRDHHLLEVCVSPIQYDYQRKKIRVCKELKYKVNYNANVSAKATTTDRASHSEEDSFLANVTLNFRPVRTSRTGGQSAYELDSCNYLIITVPKFAAAANKLAEWKRTLGFNVQLDIRNSWTPAQIYSSVHTSHSNIHYLLIIGGHEDVPGNTVTYQGGSFYSDLQYGCTGTTYTPSIYRGRIPVTTLAEANVVVDKIIGYEKTPCTDTTMYRKAIHCAQFEDEDLDGIEDKRFTLTSERVRNHLINHGKEVARVYYAYPTVTPMYYDLYNWAYGEPLPYELLKPGFGWNGNYTDIINGIDQKAFYVLYNGHGAYNRWKAPEFWLSDISSLNNGDALPVVFSISCSTGMFSPPGSFCETFLKKSGGGCVAIFGAADVSRVGPDDIMTEGMFDAIWPGPELWPALPNTNAINTAAPTPTYRLGQILDQGLRRVWEAYNGFGGLANQLIIQREHELFHCFGDPSMMFHTEAPTPFSNAYVSRNNGMMYVYTGGEEAKITFYNRSTGAVESFYGTSYTYLDDDDVTVCISAHNKIPYIDEGPLYIQNQSFSMDSYHEANTIRVGNHVITTQTQGDVNFIQGNHQLVGKEIELHPGTSVSVGATLEIRNN